MFKGFQLRIYETKLTMSKRISSNMIEVLKIENFLVVEKDFREKYNYIKLW